MSFDEFVKKKKTNDSDTTLEPKSEAPKSVPKPPAPPKPEKTKEEKVAEKREELGAEVISDEAAEAIVDKEETEAATDASEQEETVTDREDDNNSEAAPPQAPAKAAPKPSVPKPSSVPKPPTAEKKDETSPQPATASAPKKIVPAELAPQSQVYTPEELQAAVLVSDFGDEYKDTEYGGKQSMTVVGEKGAGKSTVAMGFCDEDETMLVISYDRMAVRNKYKMRYPQNIKVVDPMPLLDSTTPIKKRDSYVKIYEYLVGVEEYPNGPRRGGLLVEHEPVDWVVHDGTDILMLICEMVMRHRYDLLPSQGVEWNLWKDRKDAIQDLYNKSLTLAKKGVIFTTYFDEKRYDEDITGQKKTKEIPKWMDIILYQTLHTFVAHNQGENYFLYVHQSKSIKKDVSRKTFDITGTSFEEVDKKTGETVYKMDFTKLYEVIEQIVREVF